MSATIGSLFSGIGGFELGLERAGLGPVIYQCEIDSYCQKVLAKHWPNAIRYSDIKLLDDNIPYVDIMCGGFPCQDLSIANTNRTGLAGTHSGLWFEFLRVITLKRPRIVLIENVSGLIRSGALDTVAQGLEAIGYNVYTTEFPASMVGAPFPRSRVYTIACSNENNESILSINEKASILSSSSGHMGHWRTPFTGVGRVDARISSRLDIDRISALGNSIVPQCSYVLGTAVKLLLKD